jgi:hypothetical protein
LARDQPGVVLDHEVQVVDVVLPSPRHDLAERSVAVVGEDPCRRSGDARRAGGECGWGAVLDTEVTGDERPEAEIEES